LNWISILFLQFFIAFNMKFFIFLIASSFLVISTYAEIEKELHITTTESPHISVGEEVSENVEVEPKEEPELTEM
jgi:hypothetical protein